MNMEKQMHIHSQYERGNASEVTYETTSKVSVSGILAKQTLKEESSVGRHLNRCCETAVNMRRSQLVDDNYEERVREVTYLLTKIYK